jgi:hypothetical protein
VRGRNLFIVAVLLIPAMLCGQEVNPAVNAIDPTVQSRVQDPDRPDSPLLPGGSSAWTGQPIMTHSPSSVPPALLQRPDFFNRQFPSLMSTSTWSRSSTAVSSYLNAAGSLDPQNANQVPGHPQTASQWSKTAERLKLMIAAKVAEVQAARSSRSPEELSVAQNVTSDLEIRSRRLRRTSARSTRVRAYNPLRSRADSSGSRLWDHDRLSARALAQKQHETGMLLHHGFNARTEQRKRRRRAAAATSPNSR